MLAVADVNTGVGAGLSCVAAGIVEEHQIAGLQFGNAVNFGTHAAEPLAGSGVGQVIAELLVDVHGEAGAVEAAGGSAAVDIAGSQMLHCGLYDGGTLAAGGIAGQNQQVAADVSLRAVLAGDVVPPVYQPVDRDDGSGADGGKAGAVGAGVGTDVNRAFRHAAVSGEEIILIDRNIIGGHIAGIAVIIDLVPAGVLVSSRATATDLFSVVTMLAEVFGSERRRREVPVVQPALMAISPSAEAKAVSARVVSAVNTAAFTAFFIKSFIETLPFLRISRDGLIYLPAPVPAR